MKKFFKIAVSLCLVACLFVGSSLLLSACGDKPTELAYGTVTRDNAKTGGELSFIYDSETHTATFGGEGEVIAYYEADLEANRTAGNRVGVKIVAPSGITDYSTATLIANGKTYDKGSFLSDNSFVYIADVSEEHKEEQIKVTWQDGSKEQVYTIKIAGGTTFATADTNNTTTPEPVDPNTEEPNDMPTTLYNGSTITNSTANYNGRAYNGYNRNLERIRESYRVKRIRPVEEGNTNFNR